MTPDIADEARTRVKAARVIAQQRWPYLADILFGLRLVECHSLTTMGVDAGSRLYYNPAFVWATDVEALATVLLHEAQHVLLNHAERFDALKTPRETHVLWNLAGDAVINKDLDDVTPALPWPEDRGIRYSDLEARGVQEGMTTEQGYFAMLAFQQAAEETRDDDSTPDEATPDEATPDEAMPDHDCGSAAGGTARNYELPEDDEEAPAATPSEALVVRLRAAQAIREAGQAAPRLLRQWAEDLLAPKVNWRRVLAAEIRKDVASQIGRTDYSYVRPSRRTHAVQSASGGPILPAMRQPPPPRVAVIVDCSGSIQHDDIRRFLSEVMDIVRASGLPGGVAVIPCDHQAHPPVRVTRHTDISAIQLPALGGTDMSLGLEAAARLRPAVDLSVVLTDGFTPWPDREPRQRVIVAVSTETGLWQVPDWAKRIPIFDNQDQEGQHA